MAFRRRTQSLPNHSLAGRKPGKPQLLPHLNLGSLARARHWSKPTKTHEQESLGSASKEGLLGHRAGAEDGDEGRKHPELGFTAGF